MFGEIKFGISIEYSCKLCPALSAVRTFVSNLAQEVDDCAQALLVSQQKLLVRATVQSAVNTEYIMEVVDRTGKSSMLSYSYALP